MNYIKEIIEEGGHFDGALLVKSCERGVANNGNEYLSIVFQDVTGSINSKKWTVEANDLKVLIPGKIVMVTGDIFKYKGHPQMRLKRLKKLITHFLTCRISIYLVQLTMKIYIRASKKLSM